MAKKKQENLTHNEIFIAQKLAEEELNTHEINEPLEMLDFKSFDNNKELLDYQQQALITLLECLPLILKILKKIKKIFTLSIKSIIHSLIAISLKRNSTIC